MIDRIYNYVQVMTTKDLRGNVTPQEFNRLINEVIQEKYEEYFFDLNRAINKENRGFSSTALADVPEKIREKIQYYMQSTTISKTGAVYPKPSGARYIEALYTIGENIEVERCKSPQIFQLMNQSTAGLQPTTSYPIYLESDTTFSVLPSAIATDLFVYYLRTPLQAKWTYTVVSGSEVYNPSAGDFQDVDMHISEEEDIARRLIARFGVNLKDQQLAQYGINEENREFNQENAV